MFLQPANKLSISGRVKQAAQASGEVRSRVSSFVPLAHVLFRYSDFRMTLTSVRVRYLFCQPMDEKTRTWLLRFPAKETIIWRGHSSIGQSCCSMTSKRSIG